MTDTATRTEPLADKTVTDLLVTTEAVIRDLGRWEYVHEGDCFYRDHRGAPSCLIGHVLYRWGVLDQVDEWSAQNALPQLGASKALTDVAQEIQGAQDEGQTWGYALGAGHRAARGVEVEL